LDVERAADIIEEMDPDEAADVLGEMDDPEAANAILERLDDPEEAADIKHLLSYEEDTAGALMNTDIVCLREDFSCDQAISHLRAEEATPENLHSLFLENEEGKLTGAISLAQVVLSSGDTILKTLVEDDLITVDPQAGVQECAKLIAKYDLMSLPVVDLNGTLLGIVTVDDILDEIAPEEWTSRRND
jgi:Mg/Co/Ni transporter MgtE